MPEIRILHMADMHLEWPFAGLGADPLRGRMRREELKQVFCDIIDLALSEQVEALLIAGDLFEHTHATRGLIKFIDEQFGRIPGSRVFISPGNHDPYLTTSYYQTYPWSPNVHIFGPQPSRVDLPGLPVSVYGWGFGAWEVSDCQLGGLKATDPTRINLVLCHGGEGVYHPFRSADLEATGADYIALGHIHQGGVLLERAGRVIARYSGSPEALSFGEPGEHGVWVGSITKEVTRMRFVPTGRRRFISAAVDVTGAESLEDLVRMIIGAQSRESRLQHCFRLAMQGAVDPELTVDLPVLQEKLAGEFYVLRLEDQTRPDFDLERLALEKTARGLFVRRMMELESAASDQQQVGRIRRALSLGLSVLSERGAVR